MSATNEASVDGVARGWVDAAQRGLDRDGYWYQPDFAPRGDGIEATRAFAAEFGEVLDDVVLTQPVIDAPSWRPFDQSRALGWHGDFCTHVDRPSFSMSFIIRPDPGGSPWGDWRVAVVAQVIATLEETERGRQAIREFSERDVPFSFDGEVSHFRVLTSRNSAPALRFYGDELRDGIASVGDQTAIVDAIAALEEAADACAVQLAATEGALLVVDNWRALHYRNEQTVRVENPRQALLMFVR